MQEKANYLWLDCRLWVLQYLERHDPKLMLHIGASTQDEVSPSSGWLGEDKPSLSAFPASVWAKALILATSHVLAPRLGLHDID